MKSLIKKAVVAAGVLVVLGAGGMFWARSWLEDRLSKESLVAQMETSWSCRAQVENVSLVLMSSPARLEITGCIVAPRDAEAAKPLAQRTPLVAGKTGVSIGRAVLEVTLQDLLSRRLNVQQLTLSDVIVEENVPKEGDSSLSLMFARPDKAEAKVAAAPQGPTPSPSPASSSAASPAPSPPTESPAPATVASADPTAVPNPAGTDMANEPHEKKKKEKAVHEPEVFVASQLGFSISVKSASIVRGSFHRDDHRATTKTDVTDLNFSISEIDVNPADLASHNSLKVALSGKWKQRGRVGPKEVRREVTMADVAIKGDGTMHPFDATTGEWKPVSDLSLTMKKDSVLGGYMKLGETGSKDLKKLDDYGIDLRDLSLGGPLLADANLRLTFENDRMTLQQDTAFTMPDFELVLLKTSWLNAAQDEHEMQVRITCGQKLQEQVILGVKKFLGDDLSANIVKALADDKGRIYFEMLSTGRLSKPNVKPDVKRLMNRVLEGVGGGLLDGLIKKK